MGFQFVVVLLFLTVSAVIVGLALWLGRFLRPNLPDPQKAQIYECGERPIGSAWFNFNPRFYLIALVFIVFDAEIALTFPVATVARRWIAGRAAAGSRSSRSCSSSPSWSRRWPTSGARASWTGRASSPTPRRCHDGHPRARACDAGPDLPDRRRRRALRRHHPGRRPGELVPRVVDLVPALRHRLLRHRADADRRAAHRPRPLRRGLPLDAAPVRPAHRGRAPSPTRWPTGCACSTRRWPSRSTCWPWGAAPTAAGSSSPPTRWCPGWTPSSPSTSTCPAARRVRRR